MVLGKIVEVSWRSERTVGVEGREVGGGGWILRKKVEVGEKDRAYRRMEVREECGGEGH